jgi:hypothetical protein
VLPITGLVEGVTAGAGSGRVGMGAVLGAAFRATGLRRAALRAATFLAGLALRAVFRRATFLADAFFAEDLRPAFFPRGDLCFTRFLATVSPPLLGLLENGNQYITRVILCQDGETRRDRRQLL